MALSIVGLAQVGEAVGSSLDYLTQELVRFKSVFSFKFTVLLLW